MRPLEDDVDRALLLRALSPAAAARAADHLHALRHRPARGHDAEGGRRPASASRKAISPVLKSASSRKCAGISSRRSNEHIETSLFSAAARQRALNRNREAISQNPGACTSDFVHLEVESFRTGTFCRPVFCVRQNTPCRKNEVFRQGKKSPLRLLPEDFFRVYLSPAIRIRFSAFFSLT